jgi:prepilin-type N-terminal cleavage/methylation domain-containing protein
MTLLQRSLRHSGFSLIEVLCAILIMGFGIAGLTFGISTALISSKESELQTTAALIAAGRVELLRADGFILEGEEEGGFTGGLAMYRWRQSVLPSREIDGLYEVIVVVEHSDTEQSLYELRTLVFDPPIESDSEDSERENRRGSGRQRERGNRQ